MCGIFGLIAGNSTILANKDIERLIEKLFHLSESRGSEAAGIATAFGSEIRYFRRAMRARLMLKTREYREFSSAVFDSWGRSGSFAAIGHSRLVTNGSQGLEENNQPVATDHCVGVHNGIVVNDRALWKQHSDLSRRYEVDTEIIYRLIDKHRAAMSNTKDAVVAMYREIDGEANIAFLNDSDASLYLASNVGSIYFARIVDIGLFVFASEKYFIQELLRNKPLKKVVGVPAIEQLAAANGMSVDMETLTTERFLLNGNLTEVSAAHRPIHRQQICDVSPHRSDLRRCTRCVLPHTFPFITFDKNGVCNFCLEGAPKRTDSRATLEKRIAKHRSSDGTPDCVVALSGGRDSCYGLHYIKRELGLNPIAYTYDWAMVTDEARRNCARVCGTLGVEHIIRSADILSKRRNIRVNIEAWLRRPELGMIPLFMAGDKQFFHYASQVSTQTGLPLVFFCGGNNLEITRFKTGFCGVRDASLNTMVGLDAFGTAKLLAYYAKNVVLNPRYLNRSVFDSLFAFYSTYLGRKDFVYLYRYVDWDEKVIADTLSNHYGWESPGDSASTWRIGDGTAAFYNYIYHTVAGFSEHDTFRSNQIRAGLITRDQALTFIQEENKPRYVAMREYANLVGFSLDEALVAINNIPKIS